MIQIAPMTEAHWDAVRSIYEEGIASGNATFQTHAPDWEQWDRTHLGSPRLVAVQEECVLGWAALSGVSDRCVYAGVAEVSIYVGEKARGRGVGTALLSRLIRESEQQGIWTLQAGIFPENRPSIRLHERCGFRRVGVREKLGRLDGVWRDVVLLERRSGEVGID
jgi:phosphinothricin acetyltransferase